MGDSKQKEASSDFSLTRVLQSRKAIEDKLNEATKQSNTLVKEFDKLRLLRETWIVRRNAARKALSKQKNNENLRTLLNQAELNIELVMKTISSTSPMVEKAQKQAEAAREGLKAFQRLDIMVKTSNQASKHRDDMDDIVRSLAQISIDADLDLRGIKHAEYIIQARTELAMNKEITMGA